MPGTMQEHLMKVRTEENIEEERRIQACPGTIIVIDFYVQKWLAHIMLYSPCTSIVEENK